MSELIIFNLITILILFFVGIFLIDRFSISKSKFYRQSLADMYVVGKIKQIAKKDGIDLDKEFLAFAKVTKNKKIDFESLDYTIERELQEKLSEDKKKVIDNKDKE